MSRGRVSGSAPAQLIMASGWKFWTWRRIMPRSSSGHCQRVVAATVWPAPQAAATTRLPSIPPAPVTQSFIGGRPHKQGTQVRNRPRPCNDTGRFRVSFPLPEYPLVILSAEGEHHPLVRVLDRLVDLVVAPRPVVTDVVASVSLPAPKSSSVKSRRDDGDGRLK